MSKYEPLTEQALETWASANDASIIVRLAATALHHLARAKAAEEARDLAIVERDEMMKQRDAKAEPAQMFHPSIAVTVSNAGGMTFAELAVGDITDPAFLALTGEQYACLALVVTRG